MGLFFTRTGWNLPDLAGTLLGSIVQPLIDWGARKAEVERGRALYVEQLAYFPRPFCKRSKMSKIRSTRNANSASFWTGLERRRLFLERTVEETRDRYTNGLTDFLPVLDALKELQRIERIIVRQERALLGFRIQLHRALGGRVNATGSGGSIQ
jgi:hypothetical protein